MANQVSWFEISGKDGAKLQEFYGDLFGWTQNAGMGWEPSAMTGREFLILSTHGGIRAPDGTPIALGYHTGHWEAWPTGMTRPRCSAG